MTASVFGVGGCAIAAAAPPLRLSCCRDGCDRCCSRYDTLAQLRLGRFLVFASLFAASENREVKFKGGSLLFLAHTICCADGFRCASRKLSRPPTSTTTTTQSSTADTRNRNVRGSASLAAIWRHTHSPDSCRQNLNRWLHDSTRFMANNDCRKAQQLCKSIAPNQILVPRGISARRAAVGESTRTNESIGAPGPWPHHGGSRLVIFFACCWCLFGRLNLSKYVNTKGRTD